MEVTCEEHSEVLFKYSVKKLLVKKIVSLICLGVFVLLFMNESFWHLRQYVPESLAYILYGPPRPVHYMSPELLEAFRNRSNNAPLSPDVLDSIRAFITKYGTISPTIWYLELLRLLILSSLFHMMVPIVIPDLFANKRVYIRLTGQQLCWYKVWFFIPVVSKNAIEWGKIESAELKKSFLTRSKQIIISYTETDMLEGDEKKKTTSFSGKYLEANIDEVMQNINGFIRSDSNEYSGD